MQASGVIKIWKGGSARKLHSYGDIRNNSGSTTSGCYPEIRSRHMKIARIDRHIARPVFATARRLRIESNRRKVVYSLYKGGLEPLHLPNY